MKYFLITLFTLAIQTLHSQVFTLPLYKGDIPNSNNVVVKEVWSHTDIIRIEGVQTPDITVYLPSKRLATGQAIVICPGGGYHILAYDLEGTDIAAWLNTVGVAAVILKYRLPVYGNTTDPYKVPLMDAQRAMRIVREHAKEWNINPNEIGVMGFSAGGHLASTLGTHFDSGNPAAADSTERISCRPDFMVLMYPVISMRDSITHQGSKEALLGKNPGKQMVEYFSNELQVTGNTPQAFIVHAVNDGAVPVENSLLMAEALKQKHIPVDIHLLDSNRHGFGLAIDDPYLASWTGSFKAWLAHINK
jgi:acetyl esterase/lipase